MKGGPGAENNAAVTGYGARKSNPLTLGIVVAAHAAALAAALSYRVTIDKTPAPQPFIVQTLDLTPPPPQPAAVDTPPPAAPEIYAPTPRIILPQESPPIPVAVSPNMTSAPSPVLQAPPAPAPVPTPPRQPTPPALAQVAGGDLSSTMIEGSPPRYPIESRRRREQGTVILELVLGTDGKVSEIRVAQSSGHSRLDAAAIGAVRKWRWSPTVRDGTPVLVRGTVEIPFILTG